MCLAGLAGCSAEQPASKPLVFERDVRASYTEVRACRSPGEHSGLNAFTVWVSKDAAAAFSSIWQTPPALDRMPAGTVVVKEVYSGTTCDKGQVERWVAMRKEPGFAPGHGDWHWQEVSGGGTLKEDGQGDTCVGCHRGAGSCAGYGNDGGRDYLCTAP